MIEQPIILTYFGFPKAWGHRLPPLPESKSVVLKTKVDKLFSILKEKQVPVFFFVQGDASYLFQNFYEQDSTLSHYLGIDFSNYVNESLETSDKTSNISQHLFDGIKQAKYVFIYNIGTERVLKKAYPSKLLNSLILECKQNSTVCVLSSNESFTQFKKEYKIPILDTIKINSLIIPQQKTGVEL